MRLLASAIIALFSIHSFAGPASSVELADQIDPFEPSSCSGPIMSAERALSLLGSSTFVNLTKRDSNSYPYMVGVSRRRQKIDNVQGPWYPNLENLYLAAIYLENKNGSLGIQMGYAIYGGTSMLTCSRATNDESGHFICMDREGGQLLGSGRFEVTLTNTCARLVSRLPGSAMDTEWVYLVNY